MLMLCALSRASGQGVPLIGPTTQLQLPEAVTSGPETAPHASNRRELFPAMLETRPQFRGMPGVPRVAAPMPGTARNYALPGAVARVGGPPLGTAPSRADARPPETPAFFQRHPGRNLDPRGGAAAFTWRSSSDAKVLAKLSIGLQSDTRHTDNLANAPRSQAIDDTIMEWRPIFQFEMGSPPVGSTADASSTDYLFRLRYAPALRMLLDAGTSRTLHRVAGEIGRVSPVLTSIIRFEYDENIFGAQGDNTVEESNTVSEVSPLLEYHLSAKTAVRAEGTWRRIAPQESTTQRSEYLLETGIACAATAKTTLGTGLELGYIIFDRAQFGIQNYVQTYVSMAWQASQKIRFQTRLGVELREFDAPAPKPSRVSPVATAVLNWTPDENTQLNAGFLVRNQPSVSLLGATFQEIRFGVDGRRRFAENFYLRGEAAILRRAYDTGARELEAFLRPALGFHTHTSGIFDSLNVELYYQFRRLDSNQRNADRDRNIFGIETTLYF